MCPSDSKVLPLCSPRGMKDLVFPRPSMSSLLEHSSRSCRLQWPGTAQNSPVVWGGENRIVRFCANSSSVVFWSAFPLEQAWPPNFLPKLISTTNKKDWQKTTVLWGCGHQASLNTGRFSIARGFWPLVFQSAAFNTSSGFHFAMKSFLCLNWVIPWITNQNLLHWAPSVKLLLYVLKKTPNELVWTRIQPYCI